MFIRAQTDKRLLKVLKEKKNKGRTNVPPFLKIYMVVPKGIAQLIAIRWHAWVGECKHRCIHSFTRSIPCLLKTKKERHL